MKNEILYESSAQVSAEFILLLSGIIVIVLIAMNIYQNYITSFKSEIDDNEVNNLISKIDELKNYI